MIYRVTFEIGMVGPRDCEDEILRGFEREAAKLLITSLPLGVKASKVQIEVTGERKVTGIVERVSDPDHD